MGHLTVLYRPSRKASLAEVMESSRARPGLEPVPTTMAGVRQMIKALRAGRAVGLLPDQVPPVGHGAMGPIFWQTCLHHDFGRSFGFANRRSSGFGVG
jgi:Kdo2-lipid IVA lauroyltransferase/acyltransferase